MLVSLNWLKRYIDINESVEELSTVLTDLGLEVEGIEDFGETYSNVIVAKVKTCESHPDSDHMSITTVFDGKEDVQVVCGAPNVAAGQTIAFAPVGTVLPMPDGKPLKLKKMKLRGVSSNGMICGEDEIGLGTSHEGIIVLDNDLEAGTLLKDLGFYDVVFELNITPNRPDALSHIGVARELAAYYKREIKIPKMELFESDVDVNDKITLNVADDCGCTKYVGRVIENVKIAPSPSWLQKLLLSVGQTPINNVVDVTNFVLFEFGQPLHSFDMDILKGSTVKVRPAKEGEVIETIDHTERKLIPSDLVICDGDAPACLAGVMGGAESEITENTKRVFLECAWFEPSVVRKQARRLAMGSDSSYRYERGISPFMQEEVCAYASAMIADLAGGSVCKGIVNFQSPKHKKEADKVSLRLSRIERVLGIKVEEDKVRTMLSGIGLNEVSFIEGTFVFEVPGYRPDLEREIDLIEEVTRLVGFNAIPDKLPSFKPRLNPLPIYESMGRRVRESLSSLGLNECVSLRFVNSKKLKAFFGNDEAKGELNRSNPVELLNPINEDWGVMQTSLIPGMLTSVLNNEKNRAKAVRLYEISKVFFPDVAKRSEKNPGIIENNVLSGVIAGDWEAVSYNDKAIPSSFGILRGIVGNMLQRINLDADFKVPEKAESFLHPHIQAAIMVDGKQIGFCGQVHPASKKVYDVSMDCFVFELDYDLMIELFTSKKKIFKNYSKFGEMHRQVSVEVDEKLTNAEMLDKISKISAKNLVDVELESLYQGDKVSKGKKNMVYQFSYQHPEKTLTDKEVNKAQDKLAQRLINENEDISYR